MRLFLYSAALVSIAALALAPISGLTEKNERKGKADVFAHLSVLESLPFENTTGAELEVPLPKNIVDQKYTYHLFDEEINVSESHDVYRHFVEVDPTITSWNRRRNPNGIVLKFRSEKKNESGLYVIRKNGQVLRRINRKDRAVKANSGVEVTALNLGEDFYKTLAASKASRLPLFSHEALPIARLMRVPPPLPFSIRYEAREAKLVLKLLEPVSPKARLSLVIALENEPDKKNTKGPAAHSSQKAQLIGIRIPFHFVEATPGVATPTPPPGQTPPQAKPTQKPSAVATAVPSVTPSAAPSAQPSATPTALPTALPSITPTPVSSLPPVHATATPTPTNQATPTPTPTSTPTPKPTATPTPPPPVVNTPTPTPKPPTGAVRLHLTASKSGTGTGAVTGIGINCGTDCSEHIDKDSSVTLTATPDPGSVFIGWTGPCTGVGTCTFAISTHGNINAEFKLGSLTANKVGKSVTAATCSHEHVQEAVNIAEDGDTVHVPAGTCIWEKTLVVNLRHPARALTIVGDATIDNNTVGPVNPKTIIQEKIPVVNTQARTMTIVTAEGKKFRLAGFVFETAPEHAVVAYGGKINISGYSKAIRVDHNWFKYTTNDRAIYTSGWLYGVIDHNIYDNPGQAHTIHHTNWDYKSWGDGSWASPLSLGTEKAIYIEDNLIRGGGSAIDTWAGGRVVLRNNTLIDGSFQSHGTESSGRYRGVFSMEIYNNDVKLEKKTIMSTAYHLRGGTGVYFNNKINGNYNSIMNVNNYRNKDSFKPFGSCTGFSPWDKNDGVVYATGMHTGPGVTTLVLTDSSKNWTPATVTKVGSANRYSEGWVGYSIRNVTKGWSSQIQTNTENTITAHASGYGQVRPWDTGDVYEVLRADACIDQVGRSTGELISGGETTAHILDISGEQVQRWPKQSQEPFYIWNNTKNGVVDNSVGSSAYVIQKGRDYFTDTPRPEYSPYIYPHPEVSGAAPIPVAPAPASSLPPVHATATPTPTNQATPAPTPTSTPTPKPTATPTPPPVVSTPTPTPKPPTGAVRLHLTASKSGTGTGTVTGIGINCGTDCSEHIDKDSSVTLTATPDPGSVFIGWTGPCTGVGTCTFAISNHGNINAEFKLGSRTANKVGKSVTAATCSHEHVQEAVNIAEDGDTVHVPAGTCIWEKTLVVNLKNPARALTIVGDATIDNNTVGPVNPKTIIQDKVPVVNTQANIFRITTAEGKKFRLAGFVFETAPDHNITSYGGKILLNGYSKAIRVDHNWFKHRQDRAIYTTGWLYGVIDRNIYDNPGQAHTIHHPSWDNKSWGDGSWAAPLSLGTEKAIYIEDNLMRGGGSAIDTFAGARVVVRNNTLIDGSFQSHGTESSQRIRGVFSMEIYNNDVKLEKKTSMSTAYHLRGGTGVYFNNTINGQYYSIMNVNNYRNKDSFNPFGACTGFSPWDKNDGVVYATGTHTGPTVTTLVLTDSSKDWIPATATRNPNGSTSYSGGWVGYSIRNVTKGWSSQIQTNTKDTITAHKSVYGNERPWDTGDVYEVLRADACIDQVGRSTGELLYGNDKNPPPYILDASGEQVQRWPKQSQEPFYIWNNTRNGVVDNSVGSTAYVIKKGRDYFTDTPRPGYSPYTYPHPEVSSSAPIPVAPAPLAVK